MEQTQLRALQLVQLEELKAIADLCEQNGIVCFLDSGTLLGAVRHGGFIPWDDDVDICMDVRSYRRFLKLARRPPENERTGRGELLIDPENDYHKYYDAEKERKGRERP